MRVVLNKTYEISDDFSLAGKTRRELMEIDINADKLLLYLKENDMEICDWKILIDIIVRKLDVSRYRTLYDGDTVLILVEDRLYIYSKKTKAYAIMSLGEFDTGIYPDGTEMQVNEEVTVSFTNMYINFTCNGFVINFLIADYLRIVQQLYQIRG